MLDLGTKFEHYFKKGTKCEHFKEQIPYFGMKPTYTDEQGCR